ncbi:transposase domain-containing protein [Pseudovibrio sp. Ad37]|uniref:transposase domain-containing protein n=1 Tax=Pseudovibrio sp. Ad37 TaxID=989422 RepID=UPI0007AE6AAB|nr:transposase domain-containing protein [Pseudovibrio sp. Ad37]KZL19052.1 Bacteriophage Mu transposase [Pseudovibrio sp. Ad37]
MLQEWFEVSELLGVQVSGWPETVMGMSRLIDREGWRNHAERCRERDGQGGGFEYHVSLLPASVQAKLLAQSGAIKIKEKGAATSDAWANYERLSEKKKQDAKERLSVVARIDTMHRGGMSKTHAVAFVAMETGIAGSTLWNWEKLTHGYAREDWLAVLTPKNPGRTATAECDPRAYEMLKADYLRPEEPGFAACYRRMKEAADHHGWTPVPSAKTLKRRIERDVPAGAIMLSRKGKDAAKQLYPAQERDRSVFHAMEAVNADGHKFDVFVVWEDGSIGRPLMLALQDLHSGKMLSHRIQKSENKDAVRLAIGDMVESFGIPDSIYLDNGRSFASKWITGRMPTRFRFKVKDEDPSGILHTLGVTVHWTTPYSGQSKPIERAFRDLCEEIAKHPKCAGAYTGNNPMAKPENYGSKAIPIAEFEQHVAEQIVRHNTREGRRAGCCNGRSFEQTFRASLADPSTIVRTASEAQRRLWLMAAEGVKSRKPSGEIHLNGNRYWAPAMNEQAGSKMIVRFDPDNLHNGIFVYRLDGSFVCAAECIEAVGFNDTNAAREHARKRNAYMKAMRETQRLEVSMGIDEVANLLPKIEKEQEEMPEQRVVKLAVGQDRPVPEGPAWDEDADKSFGRAMAAMSNSSSRVVPFQSGADS